MPGTELTMPDSDLRTSQPATQQKIYEERLKVPGPRTFFEVKNIKNDVLWLFWHFTKHFNLKRVKMMFHDHFKASKWGCI